MNSDNAEPLKLLVNNLEEVETFTYIGSVFDQWRGADADVKTRVKKAKTSSIILKNIWKFHESLQHTKDATIQLDHQTDPVE